MEKKYLDIDSTYRNRNRFPLPSNFEVLISQTGRKGNVFDSIDPISDSTMFFPPPFIRDGATYPSYSYLYTTSIDTLTYQIDGIVVDTNMAINYVTPKILENYYINKYVENITDGSFRKIIDYHTETVKTQYDVGTSDAGMTSSETNILILGATSTPFTFHSDIPDYYIGKKVTIAGQTRTIVNYNPSDGSYGGSPTITVTPNWEGDPASLASTAYDIYSDVAHYITIESQFDGGHVTTSTPASTTNQTLYRLRCDIPQEVGTIVSATSNTFTLSASSSDQDNYYNGMFLWIPENNEYRLVMEYDGATRTGTINSFFTTIPSGGDPYNMLSFSRDSFSPLVYTGGSVNVQQFVCYEIELINLILPNQVLDSGRGSLIAFYPFVYVELSNLSSINNNIIYTNNPNATRALFKVPVDDIIDPLISPNISIDAKGMVQTIKFKPNDHFKFSVYLQNGELFSTEEKDYFSPSAPNPDVQISATFAIRRVVTEYDNPDLYDQDVMYV